MRDLFLLGVYCAFIFLGMRRPFVLILGYVWVDIFTPQLLAYGFLTNVPVSLLLGAIIFLTMLFRSQKPPIRIRSGTVLVGLFAIWATVTLSWAVVPDAAFAKWSWAIKSVAFSCLIPYFFRNRVQLEALVWTFVLSGMGHCIPFAVKILVSGGGYGQALGLVEVNSGYGEGSTLAMFAVSLVPMCLYLRGNSVLFKRTALFRWALTGFMICAFLTAIGTYARTGLVAIVVVAVALFIMSKRKLLVVALALVFSIGVGAFMGPAWSDRMSTIKDAQGDSSAMGRVAVWLWTMDYVSQHPLGGSFDVYRINKFDMQMEDGSTLQVEARAFHSVYFEILGELGIPGFILYLVIVGSTFLSFLNSRRRAKTPDMLWIKKLCECFFISEAVFLAGGTFIGVGFNSYFYYIVAVSVVLANICDRSIRENAVELFTEKEVLLKRGNLA